MVDYRIDGVYAFHGNENKFLGEFSVSDEGVVSGEIVDPNGLCRVHEVKGRVTRFDGVVVLDFLKTATGEYKGRMAPIEYQMKGEDGNDLEGDYRGAWRAANPELCGQIRLGQHPEFGEVAVWVPEEELGNEAEFRMTRL